MILGLHHVTATVSNPQADLTFCRDLLGLRLVKRTVNFDNNSVYHFYYGDERGTPGTIWTTFPYEDRGVPQGRKGEGQIAVTSFSVPAGSLDVWRARLRERGIQVEEVPPAFGAESVVCSDPSGLTMELVAADRDRRTPWTGGGIDASAAIRGLHGVTLQLGEADATVKLMTEKLGFEVVGETAGRMRLAVNGNEPGKFIDIRHGAGVGPAKNGLGTVHHVAMAIDGAGEQLALREELIGSGCKVTDVLDRQYFQSIYFREPGGVLFEVATVRPGFTVDEPLAELGGALKLPPWEEPNRAAIEAALPPVGVGTSAAGPLPTESRPKARSSRGR